jgi:hypothetical protein
MSKLQIVNWRPLAVIAVVLLVAPIMWMCASRREVRNSSLWLEVDARPKATSCYQGPPRQEVVNVPLWSGGPGIRLMQERQFHPPRMEDQP